MDLEAPIKLIKAESMGDPFAVIVYSIPQEESLILKAGKIVVNGPFVIV
jgi:hypothetical protein